MGRCVTNVVDIAIITQDKTGGYLTDQIKVAHYNCVVSKIIPVDLTQTTQCTEQYIHIIAIEDNRCAVR